MSLRPSWPMQVSVVFRDANLADGKGNQGQGYNLSGAQELHFNVSTYVPLAFSSIYLNSSSVHT